MGTRDKVWRGWPPPSVTHSPETPTGEGGREGAAEKEAGGRSRAHPPELAVLKEQRRFGWRGLGFVRGEEGLRIVEAKGVGDPGPP